MLTSAACSASRERPVPSAAASVASATGAATSDPSSNPSLPPARAPFHHVRSSAYHRPCTYLDGIVKLVRPASRPMRRLSVVVDDRSRPITSLLPQPRHAGRATLTVAPAAGSPVSCASTLEGIEPIRQPTATKVSLREIKVDRAVICTLPASFVVDQLYPVYANPSGFSRLPRFSNFVVMFPWITIAYESRKCT